MPVQQPHGGTGITAEEVATPAWSAVTEINAELSTASGYGPAESALLTSGLAVMRGGQKVKAAGSIAANTKIFKLPNAPAKERLLDFPLLKKAKEGKEAVPATINTSGEVFVEKALGAEEIIGYDGVVYPL